MATIEDELNDRETAAGAFLNQSSPGEFTPQGPVTSDLSRLVATAAIAETLPIKAIDRIEETIGDYKIIVETITGGDFVAAQTQTSGRLHDLYLTILEARKAFGLWGDYAKLQGDESDALTNHHVCTIYRGDLKATYVMRSADVSLNDANLPGELAFFQVASLENDQPSLSELPHWLKNNQNFTNQIFLAFSRFCAISLSNDRTKSYESGDIQRIKREMSALAQLYLHQVALKLTRAKQVVVTIAPDIRHTAMFPGVTNGGLPFPDMSRSLQAVDPTVNTILLNRNLTEVLEHMIEYPGYWINNAPIIKQILESAFQNSEKIIWYYVAQICHININALVNDLPLQQTMAEDRETVIKVLTDHHTMKHLTPLLSLAEPFLKTGIIDLNAVALARASHNQQEIHSLVTQAEARVDELLPMIKVNLIHLLTVKIFINDISLRGSELAAIVHSLTNNDTLSSLVKLALKIIIEAGDGPVAVMDSVPNWQAAVETAQIAIKRHYQQPVVTDNNNPATPI